MNLAIDCMGADNSPGAMVEGAIQALPKIDGKLYLFGPKKEIEDQLSKYETYDMKKICVVDAKEVISTSEHPVKAITKKKESSLVKAMQYVSEKKCDGVITAGNSGAFLVGSLLIIKRIEGIEKPAFAPILPSAKGEFMLIDSGANADCRPSNLLQFALMGSIYMENIESIKKPKISLLNIGIEKEKGSELSKEAYKLLESSNMNFVGNIEGDNVLNGESDVIVCDGFTGNVALKLIEGNVKTIFSIIKNDLKNSSFTVKIGGALIKPFLSEFKSKYDPNKVGGAPILGVNGICIKAHGSSSNEAFKNAILMAAKFHKKNIIGKIKESIENNL